jgi:ribosomal protein S18 acetylase RimI-like enzyme
MRLFEDVWRLKEEIRAETGSLRQQREFFKEAYEDSTTFAELDESGAVVGFVSIQDNGYILFLGVDPQLREQGIGRHLIEHGTNTISSRAKTCHVRVSNTGALAFYQSVGFVVSHRVEEYYEDGDDAFYLLLM